MRAKPKKIAKGKQLWICPELEECSDCDHQSIHKKIKKNSKGKVACHLDMDVGQWDCPKCVSIESEGGARAVAAKVFNIPMGEKKDE